MVSLPRLSLFSCLFFSATIMWLRTLQFSGASNKSGSGQPRVKNTVPGDGVGSAQDPQRQQPGDDNVQVEQVVATPANSEYGYRNNNVLHFIV